MRLYMIIELCPRKKFLAAVFAGMEDMPLRRQLHGALFLLGFALCRGIKRLARKVKVKVCFPTAGEM